MKTTFYAGLLVVASLFGLIGVAFGAFGAHFLKSRLEPTSLDALKTGVLYLFVHCIATMVICQFGALHPTSRLLKSAGILFLLGVFLFSGSLFLISTASLTQFPVRFIGFLTPLGGLCFMAGWLCLSFFGLNGQKERLS